MNSTSPLKSDLMFAVLDGEAGVDEQRLYQQNLDSDPEARRAHQFHQRFKQMVKESGQVGGVDTEVRARLMRALADARSTNPHPQESVKLQPAVTKVVELRPRRSFVPAAAPWFAAAASIALVVGLAVNRSQQPGASTNSLALALARDHSHYLDEGGPAAGSAAVNPDVTQVALHGLGRAPEMAEFPGLRPTDARVCTCSQGRQVLHVVYRLPSQELVSMYGVPDEQSFGGPLNETLVRIQPQMAQADAEALATWKRRGWVFSLVSNMPTSQLQELAQRGYYGGGGDGNGSASWAMSPQIPGPPGLVTVGQPAAVPAVYVNQNR